MRPETIKQVKKGDFFKKTECSKRVFVRGDYVRSEKAFECYDAEDINSFIYLKSNKVVFVGFTY